MKLTKLVLCLVLAISFSDLSFGMGKFGGRSASSPTAAVAPAPAPQTSPAVVTQPGSGFSTQPAFPPSSAVTQPSANQPGVVPPPVHYSPGAPTVCQEGEDFAKFAAAFICSPPAIKFGCTATLNGQPVPPPQQNPVACQQMVYSTLSPSTGAANPAGALATDCGHYQLEVSCP